MLFGCTPAESKRFCSQFRVPDNGKYVLSSRKIGQKWPKTSETQSLPFGHFIKTLGEAVNLGQMAVKEACTNFFWKHSSRNQGNLQLVQGPWQQEIWFKLGKIRQKWPKTSETQGLPLGHFTKTLEQTVNWSQMALKQACTNFFWKHSSPNQGILQLVQSPWQQEIAFRLWKIGQKWPKTSETQSLPFGHFIKSFGEAVNLGQMAPKQACTNFFWKHSSRNQGILQLVQGPWQWEICSIRNQEFHSKPFQTKRFCSQFSKGTEIGVHNFCLSALQQKPSASAVSLVSLAMGNML